jgi:putative membrane protein
LIIILSIAIPVVVALLFGVNFKRWFQRRTPYILPPIYASINGLTAALLLAVTATKNGKRRLHENLMKSAIACSIAF